MAWDCVWLSWCSGRGLVGDEELLFIFYYYNTINVFHRLTSCPICAESSRELVVDEESVSILIMNINATVLASIASDIFAYYRFYLVVSKLQGQRPAQHISEGMRQHTKLHSCATIGGLVGVDVADTENRLTAKPRPRNEMGLVLGSPAPP